MMTDEQYKPDFEIADKYMQFSSELLRLSLLVITGISGFLVLYSQNKLENLGVFNCWIKCALVLTLLVFGVCIGFCLAHRFYATDSLAYLIANLRKNTKKEKVGLIKNLKNAERMLIYAEYSFGVGVFAFIVCVVIIIANTN
jgi:hypothetical protein